jgi:hypothetical protein
MAGSLEHVYGGWSLIENMGDAHEAVEEMLWLILTYIGKDMALDLLKEYYKQCRDEKKKDFNFKLANILMNT